MSELEKNTLTPLPPLRGEGPGVRGFGAQPSAPAPSPPTPLPHEACGRGEPGSNRIGRGISG